MKKQLLIICSIIGVLLAGFQFPIYAETTPPDYSSSTSIMSHTPLDKYFYDNYELLPYLESSGSQYINTGINASNNLRIDTKFSILDNNSNLYGIYGSGLRDDQNAFSLLISNVNNSNYVRFYFYNSLYEYSTNYSVYNVIHTVQDKNNLYISNSLIHTFVDTEFSGLPIYIFDCNARDNWHYFGKIKLFNLSIYDYLANNSEGALVRDYYPARAKSSGVLGLYDAVTKTFVTTSGSDPFELPDGDSTNLSLGANINQFLFGSLSWIGAIFEGINEMPIIWVFIAIGLAGVMLRWARKIVHF